MKAAFFGLLSLLSASIPYVRATALTTAVAPNQRLCFHCDVDKAGEKIGVRSSFMVQIATRS